MPVQNNTVRRLNQRRQIDRFSQAERELQAWQKDSILSSKFTQDFDGKLEMFFVRARRLIETDAETMQNVIQTLAEEQGLRVIFILLQQNFEIKKKECIFTSQVMPFLEIITHVNVLSSLILTKHVGTIYTSLFGLEGCLAARILGKLCDILERPAADETNARRLEVSLMFFSHIVDLNSTAMIQQSLHNVAKRFEDTFCAMLITHGETDLHQSRASLDRLQRRLEVGNSIPKASSVQRPKEATRHPQVLQREGPGGRHSNDHASICDIKIMPSYEEISSTCSEYLPVNDPTQWHLGGLDGLLDRNFRLLREDTVGQLRDTVHKTIDNPSKVNSRVYHGANVADCRFYWLAGLQIEVKFPQPTDLQGKPTAEREAWWENSKRLQPGALVCLVNQNTTKLLFCTVAEDKGPKYDVKGDKDKARGALWRRPQIASVLLTLVDSQEMNVRTVLDLYSGIGIHSSLVEFPGVLLPGFEPTLKALQLIKEIPFSELLMPSSELSQLTPPLYSLRPGFAFNLESLMKSRDYFLVHPNQPVNMQRLSENSTLDEAQAAALVHCLQHKVGLIQGPPGTGKSYTGAAFIKVLLDSKEQDQQRARPCLGPIVCVTYTNHALDQLLEALLDKNITSNIIRIGGQSKSERLASLNLCAVAKGVEKTKLEKGSSSQERRGMQQIELDFNKLYLQKEAPPNELINFLRMYYPHHAQELFGEDQDGFRSATSETPSFTIGSWVNSGITLKSEPRSVEELQPAKLYDMSHEERRIIHNHWAEEIRAMAHRSAIEIVNSHVLTKSRYNRIQDELHLRCLHNADVVGMTTTGLAKRLKMLQNLQCKVVLCEEAGEVLESHLLTALLPKVEHLILIGDHQQLPPHVQNYDLSRENRNGGSQYSLDVSLFERLIDSTDNSMGCGLPFKVLETQRRMHPSIAQLIRGPSYPHLKDHHVVSNYPEVSGMRRRLFWLDHRIPEGQLSTVGEASTSHWNEFEIDMTVALVNHLVRQSGYNEGDIAVLTPYLGQLHRLREKMSDSVVLTLSESDQDKLNKAGFEDTPARNTSVMQTPLSRVLRMSTVDNFQGEEAKVVIVSLVRSNKAHNCGFLRAPQRINVLLSRAKHGMYLIGNSETSEHINMWAQVIECLRRGNNIGRVLELQCPRHPDTPITVSKPGDFLRLSPEGGCDLRCVKRLPCGHPCVQKCHSDLLHCAIQCLEPCDRSRDGCEHACPNACGDLCPEKCTVNVDQKDLKLGCGHSIHILPCWQNQDHSQILCPVLVEKTVSRCEHRVEVVCHVDVNSRGYRCREQCRCDLPCGHTCMKGCSFCNKKINGEIQVNHGQCQRACGRKQSTCAHNCVATCHGSKACPPCTAKCDVACGHSRCSKQCFEPCTPCAEITCLSVCPHSECSMPCAAPCDHVPCSRRCQKPLKCGHQCPSVCGEKCPPSTHCQICATDDIKNRDVDYILGISYKDIDLDVNPCIFPQCGHFLSMESMDAQMDFSKHYKVDADGKPIALLVSSWPFSIEDMKNCGICRGHLRNIARYGRLVRRALLDESTKKLILRLNQEFVPLAQELTREIRKLRETNPPQMTRWPEVEIKGRSIEQLKVMEPVINSARPQRWANMINLRSRIFEYLVAVSPEEQPFQRVRAMVINAQRRKMITGDFKFGDEILQTKGVLQGAALTIRLDIALLSDFLAFEKLAYYKEAPLKIDLERLRVDCRHLTQEATTSERRVHQLEGLIFEAELHAMERAYVPEELGTSHLKNGHICIDKARKLCEIYSGQTSGLASEVDNAEKMLQGGTFYAGISSKERMTIISVMAQGFTGTGHWYYCRNNHPFTIGECGGAVELASCPECGAQIGGDEHIPAPGVVRAEDFDMDLTRLTR